MAALKPKAAVERTYPELVLLTPFQTSYGRDLSGDISLQCTENGHLSTTPAGDLTRACDRVG
jgi:hypothetical protein